MGYRKKKEQKSKTSKKLKNINKNEEDTINEENTKCNEELINVLKNNNNNQKEPILTNSDFDALKKSFSELLINQCALQEKNTRQSIILLNNFSFDNDNDNNNNKKDNLKNKKCNGNTNKVCLNDFNIKSVIGEGG
ncbi:hypothetical protein BCR36DRAFT_365594 [Piromyces finnis]|uniref:Uncharacterized protein n=1 Tax=Piromyces finnis TaxID=1754191 RepID=A0A1Y1VNL7_9FUNG|nr:hypothetical protein BCR36DRAFT_365594 [Piromyces finnis]|eukprot:ORX61008.1 hypothetical protein BCR36DRAFT_365594 [Piromyces finnis]